MLNLKSLNAIDSIFTIFVRQDWIYTEIYTKGQMKSLNSNRTAD